MKSIFLILFSAFSIFAQKLTLTLEQSLEMGLENSKDIKISQSNLLNSQSKIKEFKSQMFPKLSTGANYFWISDPPIEFDFPSSPAASNNESGSVNAYSLNVGVEQPLFTGLRLSSLKSAAEFNNKAAAEDYSKDLNEQAFQIHKAFWNYYKTQKINALIKEDLASLKEHLNNTKEFLENGLVTKNEYLKLKVQLSNVELKRIDAENNLALAKYIFNRSIGIDLNSDTEIKAGNIKEIPDLHDFADYLNEAYGSRSEIKSLGLKIEAGDELITAARADYFPQLSAFGNLYYLKLNTQTLPFKNDFKNFWMVGVALKWNLWDWGNTSSKIEQAKQQKVQMQLAIEKLREAIELEVYNNYLKFKSEKSKTEVSRLSVESAEENYRINSEKYNSQLVTSTELIDSEVELLDAKTKFATSLVDLKLAESALEKSVGRKIY